jgi:hypothetical protein
MHVRFGDSVMGKAGQRLGDVDGLIVDAGTKRAESLIVDTGLGGRNKHMIAVSAIHGVDDDGVHLDETAARIESQSPTIDSEEVAFAQRVEPPTTFIPAAGVGGPVVATDPSVPGEYPDGGSFFEIAPLDPPPVEIESNLGENEVILGRDTHVISSDGHKLGKAVAFELGDMGRVDGVTASEGLIFKQQSSFSLKDIEEFGTDAVHLRQTKSEAETR